MVEQQPDFGPEEGALILASQLSNFVLRIVNREGPDETLSEAESNQIMNNYESLKQIISDQGFGKKLDLTLEEARSFADEAFSHYQLGSRPNPPDSTKLSQLEADFPGRWPIIVNAITGAEMAFETQARRMELKGEL